MREARRVEQALEHRRDGEKMVDPLHRDQRENSLRLPRRGRTAVAPAWTKKVVKDMPPTWNIGAGISPMSR